MYTLKLQSKFFETFAAPFTKRGLLLKFLILGGGSTLAYFSATASGDILPIKKGPQLPPKLGPRGKIDPPQLCDRNQSNISKIWASSSKWLCIMPIANIMVCSSNIHQMVCDYENYFWLIGPTLKVCQLEAELELWLAIKIVSLPFSAVRYFFSFVDINCTWVPSCQQKSNPVNNFEKLLTNWKAK